MVALASTGNITYNIATGRYVSEDGTELNRADLRLVVNGERIQLEGRLLQITDRYLSGELTTAEWQKQILVELKESNLRAVVLAAGGRLVINSNRRNREYFKSLREDLTDIATGLSIFTAAILAGQKTPAQIRQWAKYQSGTVFRNYSKAEILSRITLQRANEAMRGLPDVIHCRQCPGYSTGGEFIAIEDIVPVGTACDCGPNCLCWVIARYNPERAIGILGSASLAEQVAQQQANVRSKVESFRSASS